MAYLPLAHIMEMVAEVGWRNISHTISKERDILPSGTCCAIQM